MFLETHNTLAYVIMRIITMRIMKNYTLIDIFSGAGLFSAGFVDCGFRPVLAVDLSKEAVASYNRNLPPAAFAASVSGYDKIPAADVLIAGPPCQGFSTLGRQDPLDERNDLALEVPRWAKASGASIVVIENVPPFLNSPQWQTVATALRALDYTITTWLLDAVDHGAPQLRRRVFTVASKVGPVAAAVTTCVGSAERARMIPALGAKMRAVSVANRCARVAVAATT